jgi:hypothetical protein
VVLEPVGAHADQSFKAGCLLQGVCVDQQTRDNVARPNDVARDCIKREAPAIASTKTDLDTAATLLLARCSGELEAERRAFINLAPGYRDYIEPHLRAHA